MALGTFLTLYNSLVTPPPRQCWSSTARRSNFSRGERCARNLNVVSEVKGNSHEDKLKLLSLCLREDDDEGDVNLRGLFEKLKRKPKPRNTGKAKQIYNNTDVSSLLFSISFVDWQSKCPWRCQM